MRSIEITRKDILLESAKQDAIRMGFDVDEVLDEMKKENSLKDMRNKYYMLFGNK